jgi:glycine cleavage system transcriptional repressor
MPSIALISLLARDRVGLVSAVANHLFAAGINLRDTTFAAMGQGAEFTAVCELPDSLSLAGLERELTALPDLAGAQVRVVPFGFDPVPGPMGRITHVLEIAGGDQLGLIARLSDIFTQFGANIVRLDAQKLPEAGGDRYMTRFAVWLPPDRAQACLAAVSNTAGSLGLHTRVESESG